MLVPVCLSSSHIAFGSLRMEPVFMILAHSAATAASLAIEDGVIVQRVSYEKLKNKLMDDGQVLALEKNDFIASGHGIDPQTLSGLVVEGDQVNLLETDEKFIFKTLCGRWLFSRWEWREGDEEG